MKEENIIYETCENCNGDGTVMTAKLYPSGHTEVTETCTECDGSGEIKIENPLITEAKKRYPVGTHFYPAHMVGDSYFCIVTNTNFILDSDGDVYAITNSGGASSNDEKYGNTYFNRIVYYKGKWAEIKPTENPLLTEAKKRYPVGTHFYPAHIRIGKEVCIVTNTKFNWEDNNSISILTDDSRLWADKNDSKYGNTDYNRNVYYNGKWAEIKTTSDEDWLLEARKRYPVGTKFVPVHIKNQYDPTEFCIITNDKFERSSHGHIYALTNNGLWFTNDKSHGNTQSNRIIYDSDKKKWAQIIEESEKSPLEICREKYKKGMTVKSPDGNSSFSNVTFVIEEDPSKFREFVTNKIDYQFAKGWLFHNGKYAEILGFVEPEPEALKEPIQDKNKLLIEHVESVSDNLTTKNKKTIFKF